MRKSRRQADAASGAAVVAGEEEVDPVPHLDQGGVVERPLVEPAGGPGREQPFPGYIPTVAVGGAGEEEAEAGVFHPGGEGEPTRAVGEYQDLRVEDVLHAHHLRG